LTSNPSWQSRLGAPYGTYSYDVKAVQLGYDGTLFVTYWINNVQHSDEFAPGGYKYILKLFGAGTGPISLTPVKLMDNKTEVASGYITQYEPQIYFLYSKRRTWEFENGQWFEWQENKKSLGFIKLISDGQGTFFGLAADGRVYLKRAKKP